MSAAASASSTCLRAVAVQRATLTARPSPWTPTCSAAIQASSSCRWPCSRALPHGMLHVPQTHRWHLHTCQAHMPASSVSRSWCRQHGIHRATCTSRCLHRTTRGVCTTSSASASRCEATFVELAIQVCEVSQICIPSADICQCGPTGRMQEQRFDLRLRPQRSLGIGATKGRQAAAFAFGSGELW